MSDGGHPGHECPAVHVIRIQGAIHLDEDLLGQIVGVVARPSEPVADVVDSPVITLDDLLPCRCVARNTATDQQSSHMGVFQVSLPGISCGIRTSASDLRPAPNRLGQRYAQAAVEVQPSAGTKNCTCRGRCPHLPFYPSTRTWAGEGTCPYMFGFTSTQMGSTSTRVASATLVGSSENDLPGSRATFSCPEPVLD